MTAYVALLGSVNLIGLTTLKMAVLKAITTDVGLAKASTFIASDNLLFTSSKSEAPLRCQSRPHPGGQ